MQRRGISANGGSRPAVPACFWGALLQINSRWSSKDSERYAIERILKLTPVGARYSLEGYATLPDTDHVPVSRITLSASRPKIHSRSWSSLGLSVKARRSGHLID